MEFYQEWKKDIPPRDLIKLANPVGGSVASILLCIHWAGQLSLQRTATYLNNAAVHRSSDLCCVCTSMGLVHIKFYKEHYSQMTDSKVPCSRAGSACTAGLTFVQSSRLLLTAESALLESGLQHSGQIAASFGGNEQMPVRPKSLRKLAPNLRVVG